MKKSTLIKNIIKKFPNSNKEEAELFFDLFIESIVASLINNERLEIRNFGSFSLKMTEGKTKNIHLKFKAGKELYEEINKN